MPRKLPWLAETPEKKNTAKQPARSSSSTAPKRKRASSPDDLVDSDLNALNATPKRREKKRTDRSPSTSPPPAPPDVEYMQEGYNADDIYMMVEDEFLSTAKLYTQHIHHAEYVRLKKLARSRGADVLQSISRPVDGRTEQSNGLKMKLESERRAKKIKDGMSGLGEEDESSEDEYMHDPQLAGLMTREERKGKDLSGIMKAKSNTRAAAGFDQSPRNIERKRDALANDGEHSQVAASKASGRGYKAQRSFTEGDNDLDAASSLLNNRYTTKAEDRSRTKDAQTKTKNAGFFKEFAQTSTRERSEGPFITAKASKTSGDTYKSSSITEKTSSVAQAATSPLAAKDARPAVSEYLAKRRADKARREREEKRNSKRVDDVPTFLI